MAIPFTSSQFFEVFKDYNLAIWPMQIIVYLAGMMAVVFALWRTPYSRRAIWGILAFYWVWMGVAYHLLHFSAINRAAYIFGLLFLFQGLIFLWVGRAKPEVSFLLPSKARAVVGGVFLLYAMVLYPVLGILEGHAYPSAPMFGVAPCPTTIFTFGLLLWTDHKVPSFLLVIPFLWSLLGLSAAITLGVHADFGLPIAGLITVPWLLMREQKRPRATSVYSMR
jgi:hypothetical protein